MERKKFTSLAFGRTAQIGDLFDCTSQNFIGCSIFNTKIPNSSIVTIDKNISKYDFVPSESFYDKSTTLGLEDEFIVRIISDQIDLLGSGKYLQDINPSSNTRMSLIHSIKTRIDNFSFKMGDLKNISVETLKKKNVTHVLTQIQWGAITVITAETEEKPQELAELKLKAQLNKIIPLLMENGKPEHLEDLNDSTISFKIFSDLSIGNSNKFETLDGTLKFLTEIPNLLKKTNDENGKQISFHFEPIKKLKSLKLQNGGKATLKEMNYFRTFPLLQKSTVLNIIKFHEQIISEETKIENFNQKLENQKGSIIGKKYAVISNHKSVFLMEKVSFYQKLKELIVKVRSGLENEVEIEKLLLSYKQKMPFNVLMNLIGEDIKDQILSFENAFFKNAKHLKPGISLMDEIYKFQNQEIFVLFYSAKLQKQFPKDWELNQKIFSLLIESYNNAEGNSNEIFIVVDYKFHPSIRGDKIKICQYQNGFCVESNLAQKIADIETKPLARSASFQQIEKLPNNLVSLFLPCPNKNCCQEIQTWHCHSCYESILYGFDNYFYCLCGKNKFTEFEFNCREKSHGNSFIKYENYEEFKKLIDELRSEEINILILGKTGVGKSTWINSFANFISYDNFGLAEQNKLFSPIPSNFTMYDENLVERKINTGIDENEQGVQGQSATQHAKVHTFNNGKSIIRLIDTPGIADTRGVEKDKENFRNTLDIIAKYKEIHGILILLKPNDSRLDIMFQFCIKELLTNLHKDASKNLVFVFTNSRGTFYRPGETLPTLATLLKGFKDVQIPLEQKTIYCMDSESFRFLAAIKNSLKFDDKERNNYKASWDQSKAETDRLLKHIGTLVPHLTSNTLSLNAARSKIYELSKPIAEISRSILINIELNDRKKKEIEILSKDEAVLAKDLTIQQCSLETTQLPYPMTVCGNGNCTSLVRYNGIEQIHYRTVCHAHCYLKGISVNTIGVDALRYCAAMGGASSCRSCSHSYLEHLHITYVCKQILVNCVDTNKESRIKGLKADRGEVENFMQQLQKNIDEYKEEQRTIENVCAQLGVFLKKNAITPYNDSLIHYLDHLIREENTVAAVSGDYTSVNAFIQLKANYTEQFRILDEQLKIDSDSCIKASEVHTLVQSLFSLPRSGANLRSVMEVAKVAMKRAYDSYEKTHYRHDISKNHSSKGIVAKIQKRFMNLLLG